MRNSLNGYDAERWLRDWGHWVRIKAEQIGAGARAVRAAEDASLLGGARNPGTHSDPVLAEWIAVESDMEHEWSRRIDGHIRRMEVSWRHVLVCRYRGVGRRVHGVVRWERPDWPEVGRRCGKLTAQDAKKIALDAKRTLIREVRADVGSFLSKRLKMKEFVTGRPQKVKSQ